MKRTILALLAALLLGAPVAAFAMDEPTPAPHMKSDAMKKHDTTKKRAPKHASGTMKRDAMKHAPSPKPSP